jgi:hypothetical protein
MDVGFVKLMSNSFCENRVFKMNYIFSSAVTCDAVVLNLFGTILLEV